MREPTVKPLHSPLRIDSIEDLQTHRAEILERVNAAHNGGMRFLVHPFECLREMNVLLNASVREELGRMIPGLGRLSPAAYIAITNAPLQSNVRVRVLDLFKGERS
jgi:hypothetical protein